MNANPELDVEACAGKCLSACAITSGGGFCRPWHAGPVSLAARKERGRERPPFRAPDFVPSATRGGVAHAPSPCLVRPDEEVLPACTAAASAFAACRARMCRVLAPLVCRRLVVNGGVMPVIKPVRAAKQLVKHRTRLDRENTETLYAYAQFLGESTEYVLNQVIDTVLARDRDFRQSSCEVRQLPAATGAVPPGAASRAPDLCDARLDAPRGRLGTLGVPVSASCPARGDRAGDSSCRASGAGGCT